MTDHTTNYFQVRKGEYPIDALLQRIGDDYLLSIWGGKAHIGAVAMAQCRPSLQDPGRLSSTASVFCYVGHKEDELAKRMSEKLAAALGARVVVTAGMHWDDIPPDGINQVMKNVDALFDLILSKTKG